jgi:hypothetical protein
MALKWAYTPGTVEVYKSDTRRVITRFLSHHLSFPNCISGLDAALARLIPRLIPEPYQQELPTLRAVMLANNERVMKEMEHRS